MCGLLTRVNLHVREFFEVLGKGDEALDLGMRSGGAKRKPARNARQTVTLGLI